MLHSMAVAAASVRPLRLVTLHPNHDWSRIWRNMITAWIPDAVDPHGTWQFMTYCPPRSVLTELPSLETTALPTADRLTPCLTA